MFDLVIEPQVTPKNESALNVGVFVQCLELKDGDRTIARARWASSAESSAGVAQLL